MGLRLCEPKVPSIDCFCDWRRAHKTYIGICLCVHTCNSVTSFLSASCVNALCMLDRINCFWAFTSGFHLWDAKMFLGSCSMSNRRARSLSCWVKFFDRCLEGFWAIAVRTTGSSGSSYPWNRSRFKYGTELFNGTVNESRMIIYLHHLEVHRTCRRAKCRCIGILSPRGHATQGSWAGHVCFRGRE